jgi:hypothetical protein
MSYYFKCEGLTKPQIIKAAKQLAERGGLKLVDSFEKDLNELNRRYPCEVVVSKCKRVLFCIEDPEYRRGFKELKVTIKPKKLKYFKTAGKTPCEIMLKIAELEEGGKFKLSDDTREMIQAGFHEVYEFPTIRQTKRRRIQFSLLMSDYLKDLKEI